MEELSGKGGVNSGHSDHDARTCVWAGRTDIHVTTRLWGTEDKRTASGQQNWAVCPPRHLLLIADTPIPRRHPGQPWPPAPARQPVALRLNSTTFRCSLESLVLGSTGSSCQSPPLGPR